MADHTISHYISVCVDCMLTRENGEPSPDATHEPWSLLPAADVTPDWNMEPSEGETYGHHDFATTACDGCGDPYAGERYSYALWA